MDQLLVRRAGSTLSVLLLVFAAACTSGPAKKAGLTTTVAPGGAAGQRWMVCGQDLSQTAAGFYVEDASDHDITVTRKSPPGDVYLQFSHDCKADPHFQVTPPGAATVRVGSPPATPVGVVLTPTADKFTVTFQRPSGPGKVTVDFTGPPPT